MRAASNAFQVGVSFPLTRGEPVGATTPEELLAASHAMCFGIGLRSVLARHGGRASRISVTATISAEKGEGGIRVRSSRLRGVVQGLEGLEPSRLPEMGKEAEQGCTIAAAVGEAVKVEMDITAAA